MNLKFVLLGLFFILFFSYANAGYIDMNASFLEDLNNFQAPWLAEKLLSKKSFNSMEEYNVAFTEFNFLLE